MCVTSERVRGVVTCAIRRITNGMAPATSISWVHISGTSPMPSSRAATAGNSLCTSGVAVNTIEMTSSLVRSLDSRTAVTSSRVEARACSRSSASSWMAPRTARTETGAAAGDSAGGAASGVESVTSATVPIRPRQRPSQARCLVQPPDLGAGERAHLARAQLAEVDRADVGAHQRDHGVPHGLQQASYDVLASLVQHDLDQGLARGGVDDLERVDLDRPVLQLDAGPQRLADVARHRAGDLRQVGLGDAVRRVLQPV